MNFILTGCSKVLALCHTLFVTINKEAKFQTAVCIMSAWALRLQIQLSALYKKTNFHNSAQQTQVNQLLPSGVPPPLSLSLFLSFFPTQASTVLSLSIFVRLYKSNSYNFLLSRSSSLTLGFTCQLIKILSVLVDRGREVKCCLFALGTFIPGDNSVKENETLNS